MTCRAQFIDGSYRNLISDNLIVGGDQGIRIYGPAVGNRLERNAIHRPRSFGILLDRPSHDSTVEGNLVSGASDGIRIRDARESFVTRNTIRGATGHGIKIDGFPAGRRADVRVLDNAVTGAGASPFGIQGGDVRGVAVVHNPNSWAYPLVHRLAQPLTHTPHARQAPSCSAHRPFETPMDRVTREYPGLSLLALAII